MPDPATFLPLKPLVFHALLALREQDLHGYGIKKSVAGRSGGAIDVEPGTYDEIEFDIHKVSNDDPEDADFRAAHPDFIGVTIRVQGTYNGTPFTYTTDLNEEQEFEIAPPLVIDENTGSVNLTIRFDLSQWFRDGQGGLLDPATGNKGGDNESLINENIKQSLEAFEDEDRDGEDDL